MRLLTSKSFAALTAIAALAATTGLSSAQDKPQLSQIFVDPPGKAGTIRPVQRRAEGLQNMILLNDPQSIKAVKKIELGKYWIGLNCAEVSPALRSQLKLKDGQGLLVVNAFEGSPSRKAGLKEHDVVVKAGDKEIGAVGQLIEAVQKSGESEITLDIIRKGQLKTITVKSAERPVEQQGQVIYLPGHGSEHRLLFRTPQGFFTFIEPGVVVNPQPAPPRGNANKPPLPADVSITVTRRTGQRTTIHVQQEDQSWDISPNEIEKLPKDLQPHVAAMIAPANTQVFAPQWTEWIRSRLSKPGAVHEHRLMDLPEFAPLKALTREIDRHSKSTDSDKAESAKVESEIEKIKRELTEEMKQLRKAIDELKESNKQK